MKLYEIEKQYMDLLKEMETSEDVETITYALDAIEDERSVKLDSIAKYLRCLDGEIASIDAEIARLSAMKKTKSNAQKSMKNYIAYSLTASGIHKTETDLFKFSFRKSESVKILDKDVIPKEFITENIDYAVDKTAIKEAIKSWETIEGATLLEKQNLQIK